MTSIDQLNPEICSKTVKTVGLERHYQLHTELMILGHAVTTLTLIN